jgi:hypothetical protein
MPGMLGGAFNYATAHLLKIVALIRITGVF